MMTVLKTTKILLDRITRIEVDDAKDNDVLELSERRLMISTEDGEKYELILEAEKTEQLEFKKWDKDSWLMPKLYKGSRAMRLEEEE